MPSHRFFLSLIRKRQPQKFMGIAIIFTFLICAPFLFSSVASFVFFPDPLFDLPIFGLDLVKINNLVSAAIVDLSPVSDSLINDYEDKLRNIQKEGFTSIRKIPEWGTIFSKNVLFASLNNEFEKKLFYDVVDQYLTILIEISKNIMPDLTKVRIEERIKFQKEYCKQQIKNDKTSSVLQKYFNKNWVDKYLNEILFDFQ